MTDEPPEQPKDILSHLQAAAKELIAAGRGVLDAADEVISDRLRFLGAIVGEPTAKRDGAHKPAPTVEKIEVERED